MPSNLLALRTDCHNLHPLSVHMDGRRSRERGWLISTFDARPFDQVPVLWHGTRWVFLTDDGGFADCLA